ncbi:2-hydroxyacid dehydrogenase family phosphoglycerate dehydrogenase [Rhizoctonia solani AG-3 Rhs1AP]|uniref:2-hydroxyacid dehydrogenase family phosphoglycerate dehydrogenase n=2 Tax=Rhizoctonia solani AG-3 TaxID=1086053 RepID=A0A074RUM2_9AGAM|nr:2-hydroxyacid dehydrogenase family phosphoglycerate dehydrogenase [Rhizoctonia solani AG-3 Rhs1AP]KEP50604.1 2-hydroxyacid dehydrogenase family phosphoglycerate dehydrogenase [Rhizoctonia solani 123E]
MWAQMTTTNDPRRGIIICVFPNKLQAKDRIKLLEAHHHVSVISPNNRQALIADFQRLAAERPYHAILFFPGFIKVAGGKWDAELFSLFYGSLRLVTGSGSGFDHVNVEYLTRIGAYYANAPTSVSEPTATTTVTLILQTIRATTQAEMTLRRGEWAKGLELTDDIRDLTVVGIIGYGNIGRLVQKKLQALGVKKFFYHNRHRISPADENGAVHSSLDQLLSESDLVTLHCPLTSETRHILSDKQFTIMKHGAYIVNTSRGPVIDEEALVRAMKSGQISRVGLDVFENEPEVHPYLMASERATLLPHWGSKVKRVFHDVEHESLDNLDAWLETGVPKSPINQPALATNNVHS